MNSTRREASPEIADFPIERIREVPSPGTTTRDEAEVDKYIADPFCGIRFAPASQASFMALRERRIDPEALAKVRRGLPVYVFVGDADPINDNLKRLSPLIDAYKAAGLDVTLKVYPGGRHEMLNETNRAEVVADLKVWLDRTVHSRGPLSVTPAGGPK